MSDSPPPYSPPSYRPSPPSVWTRVLDSVPDLGVADTVEDLIARAVAILENLLPRVAVAVEDLRPRAKYVQTTLAVVKDIRFCEKLFDNSMTELDNVMSSSKEPNERERQLIPCLRLLKEDAGRCSDATKEILQCHVQFASLMAQRIEDASDSQYNLKYDDSETTRLANDISEASRSLSMNVTRMMNNLDPFVSALEDVQVAVEKEPLLAEQILGWLKSLFKAIASILATVYSPVPALLPSAQPNRQIPDSTLAVGAATFFTADPEHQEGKVSESLDSLILFLGKIVPRQIQNAEKKLGRFDEALYIMGLESRMRAGRRVTPYGPDPAVVAKEWRDVAKQYQSVLPDNEDPPF